MNILFIIIYALGRSGGGRKVNISYSDSGLLGSFYSFSSEKMILLNLFSRKGQVCFIILYLYF